MVQVLITSIYSVRYMHVLYCNTVNNILFFLLLLCLFSDCLQAVVAHRLIHSSSSHRIHYCMGKVVSSRSMHAFPFNVTEKVLKICPFYHYPLHYGYTALVAH